MNDLIDLPKDIEPGTEILVWNSVYGGWVKRIYIGQWDNAVYALSNSLGAAYPYGAAKIPETDWSKIPIGTSVNFWNDKDTDKFHGYLVAVINGVPFCSQRPIDMYTLEGSRFYGGYSIKTWEHVEIVEEV